LALSGSSSGGVRPKSLVRDRDGNTDDHLKNFSMLHKETGFCLSPAYDLLPDIHGKRSHSLSFPEGAG
jgi:hypothetical protein